MKKIQLIFAMLALCTVMFGQNLLEKRANYFVDAAEKEFSLMPDQKAELLKTRLTYLNDMALVFKQFKAEEITEAEKIEKNKVINQKMRDAFEKITAKTNKDLLPFYDRMKEELQTVK